MSWKYKALLHAQREDPKESCGLLLNIKGKERYYPCRNLSMTEHQCFIIDPEDYVKADNTGEIVGVVHSHPITPPNPSQADKISCEDSNLPWYIVNPKTEQWAYLEPCGYKPPLLGREWVWGVTDCWSLVVDWYKEEKLEDGDVLLMSILHPTLNHVALFFEGDVIHHLTDRLSCREPYSEWLLKCTGKRYRYAQKS